MPIIGTPVNHPTAVSSPALLTPVTSRAYGEALLGKRRAVTVASAALAVLEFPILNANGSAMNLASPLWTGDTETANPTVELRFREAVSSRVVPSSTVAATVHDAALGVVRAEIPTAVRDVPGVYMAEFGVLQGTQLVATNECAILVQASAWNSTSQVGPPALADLRLSLRDSDPNENELIDSNDYDLAEICWALTRTVQFWNESLPPVRIAVYSSCTFPFRDIWLMGAHTFLFEIAAEHYRRNQLPYAAGNVQLDDKNKERNYEQAWTNRYQRFKSAVQQRKVQINASQCWLTVGSRYPQRYR